MERDPGLSSWLRLTLTPGIGPAAIRGMLRQFGLPENIISRKPSELASFTNAEAIKNLNSGEVEASTERALQWASHDRHFIVTLADEAYPRALLEISDPPPLLYAIGKIELL